MTYCHEAWCENHGKSRVEIMGKRERNATPTAFRDALLELARGSRRKEEAA